MERKPPYRFDDVWDNKTSGNPAIKELIILILGIGTISLGAGALDNYFHGNRNQNTTSPTPASQPAPVEQGDFPFTPRDQLYTNCPVYANR